MSKYPTALVIAIAVLSVIVTILSLRRSKVDSDTVASFRKSWGEALEGMGHPVSELWDDIEVAEDVSDARAKVDNAQADDV